MSDILRNPSTESVTGPGHGHDFLAAPAQAPLRWDSGQRHGARPWFHLCVLGLVLLVDLIALATAPFLLANSDEPLAVWIALGLLGALTLKLALEGTMRSSVHLERVTLGASGLVLDGARLTMAGTAYQALDALVAWRDVGSVEWLDAGTAERTTTVVDIRLSDACPFGRVLRLVHLSRSRAQAFADKAAELRARAIGPASQADA